MKRNDFLYCLLAGLATPALGQKYKGARPPKPDIPYLQHADDLIPAEVAEAKEETGKDEVTYVIAGASSPVRTPLAGPVFLLEAQKLDASALELYPLEVRNGRRQISFFKNKRKQKVAALRLTVRKLDENLFRIEAYDSLSNGEYSLSPSGSNQVFCFEVY